MKYQHAEPTVYSGVVLLSLLNLLAEDDSVFKYIIIRLLPVDGLAEVGLHPVQGLFLQLGITLQEGCCMYQT